jgi:hypothetical protein
MLSLPALYKANFLQNLTKEFFGFTNFSAIVPDAYLFGSPIQIRRFFTTPNPIPISRSLYLFPGKISAYSYRLAIDINSLHNVYHQYIEVKIHSLSSTLKQFDAFLPTI